MSWLVYLDSRQTLMPEPKVCNQPRKLNILHQRQVLIYTRPTTYDTCHPQPLRKSSSPKDLNQGHAPWPAPVASTSKQTVTVKEQTAVQEVIHHRIEEPSIPSPSPEITEPKQVVESDSDESRSSAKRRKLFHGPHSMAPTRDERDVSTDQYERRQSTTELELEVGIDPRLLRRGSEEEESPSGMEVDEAEPVASTSATPWLSLPGDDVVPPTPVDMPGTPVETIAPNRQPSDDQEIEPKYETVDFNSPAGRLSFRLYKSLSNPLGPHYIEILNSDGDRSSWPSSTTLKPDSKGHINGYVQVPHDNAEQLRWRTTIGKELADYQQFVKNSKAFP
jgi:hypothetical protein